MVTVASWPSPTVAGLEGARIVTHSICFGRITDIADVLIDMRMGIVLGLPE
jgi:hypothetical protein